MIMHCNRCGKDIDNSMGFFCFLCGEHENIGKGVRYSNNIIASC